MPHSFFYYAWLLFMACGFLAWYFSHKGKQEERKMLIQQGADLETLLKKDKKSPSWILKIDPDGRIIKISLMDDELVKTMREIYGSRR